MAAVVAMAAFSFLLIATDQGESDAAAETWTLSNDNATVDTAYTKNVSGSGFFTSSYYNITPSWLSVNYVSASQLRVSGTPSTAGTYNVTMLGPFAQGGGDGTWTWTITVTGGSGGGSGGGGGGTTPPATVKPVASFTYAFDGDLKVNFSDTSTNTPTSWTWAYGDGTSSTAKSPSKTYAAAGTYNVTLTATNSAGSGSHTRAVTVNATPGATACTVTFDTDGGTAITAAETTVGANITLPAAIKANKTFTGWYVGASFVGNAGSNYAVTGNATLTAHWADVSTTKYTVTFFHEGRALSSQDVVSGGKATDPGAPAGKGKFTGWATSNGTVYSFATPVTANLNLYAQFDAPSIWDNNLIMYALIGLVVVLLIVAIARTIG